MFQVKVITRGDYANCPIDYFFDKEPDSYVYSSEAEAESVAKRLDRELTDIEAQDGGPAPHGSFTFYVEDID